MASKIEIVFGPFAFFPFLQSDPFQTWPNILTKSMMTSTKRNICDRRIETTSYLRYNPNQKDTTIFFELEASNMRSTLAWLAVDDVIGAGAVASGMAALLSGSPPADRDLRPDPILLQG